MQFVEQSDLAIPLFSRARQESSTLSGAKAELCMSGARDEPSTSSWAEVDLSMLSMETGMFIGAKAASQVLPEKKRDLSLSDNVCHTDGKGEIQILSVIS